MAIQKWGASIIMMFILVVGGANFSQADEHGSNIINDIVKGYNSNLAKIKSGSCIEIVISTGKLPEEQINHYKDIHTLKFTGPYLRWDHMAYRKVTSADGKIIKEVLLPIFYDTYIDKEKGICYGYIGDKYEIRKIDSPNTVGDPKLYRIMPQEYGRPSTLLHPKELTNKFVRYEEIDGRRCALIESKRVGEKTTTIAHTWVDTESYLVLKEEDWMRDNASDKTMPIYKAELRITLCDKKNSIFGPRIFKEVRYEFPNFSTGKSEVQGEETRKFEDLVYNIDLKKSDLIMTIPKGAKVIDYAAGGILYTAE